MKTLLTLTLTMAMALPTMAQKHEVGLMLGRIVDQDRTVANSSLKLKSGMSLHANYPQRQVESANRNFTRDVASLYLTPELRLKFAPKAVVSPFVFAGAGLAVYEHAETTLAGAARTVDRTSRTGAFTYGGGIDVKVLRWLGARFEARDNYSGSPQFLRGANAGRQHNFTLAGGFVLRFGE
jgi:opacity protein-like surface antigen